ncbi:SIR2 family NAD-dependent protein deacylase [Petrotoga olearia]|uniref:protein acetyllysine N-acetyltransferase n=2 Tax=Petrotoga olearia TaxID=156203 RepID=A0A2K1P291_9BACT|nr:Sir2 family NAD-dependent protein deacetylase [Petrotoga olearia]KUK15240.1 MAG: Silent information regulator protein Sir2 [Petrotoga mobilis]PNR96913.1 sigma factor [Petrotoga olearia DSM 13574]RMA70579.1 NAD-dependent deacetylase [Petrotoga olearia]HBT50778.1 RNA polymerase subunit sigma [Petrotoga sp.]
MSETAKKCAELIYNSNSIAVLSGAGMSTNAGIPDFRGPNGIYTQANIENPERIFDIDYFYTDPSLFYKFHKKFLEYITKAEPTFTHKFLVQLEKEGKLKGIVTQNIDSLHQKSGSKKVYEIHGGCWENHCIKCNKEYPQEEILEKINNEIVPKCDNCGGVIKPDIVFFGEPVKYLTESELLMRNSDLVLVLGSSLVVIPAAMLPSLTEGKIIVVTKGEASEMYLPQEKIALIVNEELDTFFTEVAREYSKLKEQ